MKKWAKAAGAKGAALVEYGILVGLIAVLAIVAVFNLGDTVRDTFVQVSSTLSSNIASATDRGAGAGGAGVDTGANDGDVNPFSIALTYVNVAYTGSPEINPVSDSITPTGFTGPVAYSVSFDGGFERGEEVLINGVPGATSGVLQPGQSIALRGELSRNYGEATPVVETTLTIGDQ